MMLRKSTKKENDNPNNHKKYNWRQLAKYFAIYTFPALSTNKVEELLVKKTSIEMS
jgi:hypothetical protein